VLIAVAGGSGVFMAPALAVVVDRCLKYRWLRQREEKDDRFLRDAADQMWNVDILRTFVELRQAERSPRIDLRGLRRTHRPDADDNI
jgi:hypothetical protein